MRRRARTLTGQPRVSVVIPCYNYGRFLPQCVAAALAQPGIDVEVIVVDDASPDGSAEVAHRLAAADSRVKVIAQATNQGHIRTFNEGLDAATGEYVVLISADDLLAPGALARSAAVLQAHPSVGLVYGFAPVFSDVPPRPRTWLLGWTIWTGQEWLERVCARGRNVMHSPEAMMRTSVLRAIGGYNPHMPKTSDLYMWLCAAAHSDIAFVDGPDQAYYRVHGENMTTVHFDGPYQAVAQRHHTFGYFFDHDGAGVPGADRLRQAAFDALGREAAAKACQWYNRGLAPGDDPTRLGDLALQISPSVRQTRLWQEYERRGAGPVERTRRGPKQVAQHAVRTVPRKVGRRFSLRRVLHFGTPTPFS